MNSRTVLDYSYKIFNPRGAYFKKSRLYSTEGGQVFMSVGGSYFVKMGGVMLKEHSKKGYKVSPDGGIRFSSEYVEDYLYYIYYNRYDKDFLVKINNLDCLKYECVVSNFTNLSKCILDYWCHYVIPSDIKGKVHRGVGGFIRGAIYSIKDYIGDYVYLGLQEGYCLDSGKQSWMHVFVCLNPDGGKLKEVEKEFKRITSSNLNSILKEHGGNLILNPDMKDISLKSSKLIRDVLIDNNEVCFYSKGDVVYDGDDFKK